MKVAIITGVTGQDGSYLAELLLSKNYEVHGLVRRTSSSNSSRIKHLLDNKKIYNKSFFLHYFDVSDSFLINNLVNKILPDEIYNLAAQSDVGMSFKMPTYTMNVNIEGVLNILESIRGIKRKKIKFYQASTSELFGKVQAEPQKEDTPFYPRSPYAISKLCSFWITKNYREAYKIFSCNGILYNHESPRRGERFVTKKITQGLAKIYLGIETNLQLGNLNAKRDWGHANDYVRAMWLMLQQKKPKDYIISTGESYSVREFIIESSLFLGMKIRWSGEGLNEVGFWVNPKKNLKYFKKNPIISISKKYFRPTEVDILRGDPSLAKKNLKWKPKVKFSDLVKEMINYDLNSLKNKIK